MKIAAIVKMFVSLAFVMSVVIVHGNDDVKRVRVGDAELLCRIDKDIVDTISLSALGNGSVVAGQDFLNRVDDVFAVIRGRRLRLSKELRLYLGNNLPLEMKKTLYQVISEHYASKFAQKNFAISSSGRGYAHKLIGRGYFKELDSRLSVHGYGVKSACLEKVIIDMKKKVAEASMDLTLMRQNVHGAALETSTESSSKVKPRIQSGCVNAHPIQSKPHTRLRYDMGGGTNVWFFSFMRCRMKNNEDYTYYRYRNIPKNAGVYYEGGGMLKICDDKFIYFGKTNSLHAAGNWVVEPTATIPNSFIW